MCKIYFFNLWVLKAAHSPSLSISKTLMASCVLSGRTSLAGSVCLLWIPGETEGELCIGLMKGWAPTTDIIRIESSSPPELPELFFPCLCLCWSPPRCSRITSVGPCEKNWTVSVCIYGTAQPGWFTGWFAFEYLRNEWMKFITAEPCN